MRHVRYLHLPNSLQSLQFFYWLKQCGSLICRFWIWLQSLHLPCRSYSPTPSNLPLPAQTQKCVARLKWWHVNVTDTQGWRKSKGHENLINHSDTLMLPDEGQTACSAFCRGTTMLTAKMAREGKKRKIKKKKSGWRGGLWHFPKGPWLESNGLQAQHYASKRSLLKTAAVTHVGAEQPHNQEWQPVQRPSGLEMQRNGVIYVCAHACTHAHYLLP